MLPAKYLVFLSCGLLIPPYMYMTVGLYYMMDWFNFIFLEEPFNEDSFIVVGAGSAGSVVAGRLAEAGHQVILVEAGGHSPYLAHVPNYVGYNQFGPIDWQYKTQKQDNAGLAFGGISNWPRGKVLGGSSILNYMMYLRGHSRDYDEWTELGISGWSYKDVLPFFIKSENFEGHLDPQDIKFHGTGGPLTVINSSFTESYLETYLEAGKEKGYPTADPNGSGETRSFCPVPASIGSGERAGTYKAFAQKYTGGNIRLVTHAHVNKVVFDGKKAVGIELERFGKTQTIYTKKEIVLSAGSIGTPQILMLSGVGDQEKLSKLDIQTVLHSPQVGLNLQDHIFSALPLQAPENITKDVLAMTTPQSFIDYFSKGKGPHTSIGGVVGTGFIHTKVNKDPRPDIQLITSAYLFNLDSGLQMKKIFGVTDSAYNWLGENSDVGVTICSVLSRPKSVGEIKLRSKDPRDYPIIEANYLDSDEDVKVLASAVEFMMELTETEAFKNAGIKLFKPYPACNKHEFKSQEYLNCYVRHWTQTLYHPVGTAAMGTVLDSRLKVKGLENLRVADGAAMPKIVGGNTNAPIIMMGEKAADFILHDWNSESIEIKSDNTKKSEL